MSTPAITPQQLPDNAPTFTIQRVYVKGVSLEMPNAPQIFLEQGQVEINFNVQTNRTDLEGDSKEVSLRATIEAKINGKNLYLLEIDQAGIFELKNVPADQMELLLQVNCPTILTAYLRAQISNTLTQASVTQFMLPEINWLSAYQGTQQLAPAANDKLH